MRHQPEPIYATLLGTFQQANDIPAKKNSYGEKTTTTRMKPPCGKVDASNVKEFLLNVVDQN
jgi:hypothetical protein